MATDLEKLVVQLQADVRGYQRNLDKARGQTDNTAKAIERRFDQMNKKVAGSFDFGKIAGGIGRAAMGGLGALGVGVGAREVIKAADAWTEMSNRLRGAGIASSQLAVEQRKVVDLALASRTSLEVTSDLYAKLLGITQTLGVSQSQAAIATQAISQALTMSGVSAGAAAGAITQLGQALGSGVLRGDEFNSVMEALGTSSPIIKAIAQEFGVATTELRGLAENGELVADRVFGAIIRAAPEIARAFDQSLPTVQQAFENAATAATSFLGTLDSGIGISYGLAKALNAVASAAASAAAEMAKQDAIAAKNRAFFSNAESEAEAIRAAAREQQQYRELVERNRALGIYFSGRRAGGAPMTQAPGGLDEGIRGRAYNNFPASYYSGPMPPTRPQSGLGEMTGFLGDMPAKGGGGGGGGSPRKQVAAEVREVTQEVDTLGQSMQDLRDVADAGLSTLVSGLLSGRDAAESLEDAIKSMLERLASMAQNSLLDALFKNGGIIGQAFGLPTFGTGDLYTRAAGGPVSAGTPYLVGEQGPELMVPGASGTIVPNDVLRRGGGNMSVVVNNMSGGAVSTQERTTPGGGKEMIVTIDRVVADRIGTGGTATNKVLRSMGGRMPLTRR